MLVAPASSALVTLVALTLLALLVFGFVQARFTGTPPLRGALQTLATGGLAAAAAFGIGRLIS